MKKMPNTLDNIKDKITKLKGCDVNLYINRGRRKITSYRARIEEVYASVFTVKPFSQQVINTYSYSDILCGDVKISND